MSHRKKVIYIIIGVALVLATIHFTINGFPALSQFNPHAH